MTKIRIHENFIAFMERTRGAKDWSISEMARYLGMSESTYKNILYGKSSVIDISIACRLYEITGRWMWEMCGYYTTDNEFLDLFCGLSEKNRRIMMSIAKTLMEEQIRDNL